MSGPADELGEIEATPLGDLKRHNQLTWRAASYFGRNPIQQTDATKLIVALNISRATLYRYFPRGIQDVIEDITAEANVRAVRGARQAIERLEPDAPLDELVSVGAAAAINVLADDKRFTKILVANEDLVLTYVLGTGPNRLRAAAGELLATCLSARTAVAGNRIEISAQPGSPVDEAVFRVLAHWAFSFPDNRPPDEPCIRGHSRQLLAALRITPKGARSSRTA